MCEISTQSRGEEFFLERSSTKLSSAHFALFLFFSFAESGFVFFYEVEGSFERSLNLKDHVQFGSEKYLSAEEFRSRQTKLELELPAFTLRLCWIICFSIRLRSCFQECEQGSKQIFFLFLSVGRESIIQSN